jgi:predicted transport protein
MALERCGKDVANKIDWESPRLLCIASDFTKYDSHAVQQMNHNIELIRYRWFGQDQLLLELVNAVTHRPPARNTGRGRPPLPPSERARPTDKTVGESFATMPPELREVFDALERHVMSLGDDVQRKDLKLYVAFKRLRNFATVCFQKHRLQLYLRLDPDSVDLEEGFSKDVRNLGHWGTGDVEVSLSTPADLTKAKPLIARAYAGNSHAG